jgi:hypothetical protein
VQVSGPACRPDGSDTGDGCASNRSMTGNTDKEGKR